MSDSITHKINITIAEVQAILEYMNKYELDVVTIETSTGSGIGSTIAVSADHNGTFADVTDYTSW